MPRVEVGSHESLDRALKRFKRKLEQDGLLKEYRDHEFYEKPSSKKRRKMKEARSKKTRRTR